METFNPRDIYHKLDLPAIIGDKPIHAELQVRSWPADNLAFVRLFTEDGRNGWTLIAPGCTVESTEAALRRVADRLAAREDHAGCGGDACGI